MRQIFVTGATGFIGRHLVAALRARGDRCRCLVRASSNTEHLQQAGVELIHGAIDQPETYAQALHGCDLVIHLAGLTHALARQDLFHVNAAACGLLADACVAASVPRAVYVSSLAAAGPPPAGKQVREEADPDAPVSDYGRSKLQGEQEFRLRADKLATTVIRPGVVYGPEDEKIRQLVASITDWRLHVVIGFRTPPLSLIHVDDLVELILAAADRGESLAAEAASAPQRAQGIYFACDDSEFVTYAEFGRRIARAAQRRVLVWPIWRWVGLCVGWSAQSFQRLRGQPSFLNVDKVREATAWSWASSGQKAREQLGFSPKHALDDHLPAVTQAYAAQRGDR